MIAQAETEYFLALILTNAAILLAAVSFLLFARKIGADDRPEMAAPAFIGFALLNAAGVLPFLYALLMSFAAEPSGRLPETFGTSLQDAQGGLVAVTLLGASVVAFMALPLLKHLVKKTSLLAAVAGMYGIAIMTFALLQLALSFVAAQIMFPATYFQGGMLAFTGNIITFVLMLLFSGKIVRGLKACKAGSGGAYVALRLAPVVAPALLLSLAACIQMYL